MPDNLKKGAGHFNVFLLDEFSCPKTKNLQYRRKDYYKISLVNGHTKIYYADKFTKIEQDTLIFSNPLVPYLWESDAPEITGFYCIFSEAFFNHFGHLKDYPVFKPGSPLFLLADAQLKEVKQIFLKMLDEISSGFAYRYDVLRNLVFKLIYMALKMQPATSYQYSNLNGPLKIASIFTELLERQFPIESPMQFMKLRSPVDFANQLSVHVNHLNRSLKTITGKTTSQLIAERVVQEAYGLLKHTNWNISEISWSLGFGDLSHFINFFIKYTRISPKVFRQMQDV